jgi:aconitate hydratase
MGTGLAAETLRELGIAGERYNYCSLAVLAERGHAGVHRLPFTLKVVLENLLRQQLQGGVARAGIEALLAWPQAGGAACEIGFRPARVMMVDASGIPLLADFAAMRDAMQALGGDPARINPAVPVDFVVDHSISVDHSGSPDALRANLRLEFERNEERYAFIKWGAEAFENIRVIPPGAGICHQVNLEYLAQVVWTAEWNGRRLAYPDSVLGMDSHTPMINSLGVVGWGVGGLEGASAALGEPVSMLIPEVVGCRLSGTPQPGVTATDIVLTITQALRRENLIGAFVEYLGPGVDALEAADRATIANMTPETGATMGFFPVDRETLRFLRLTGRSEQQVALVEAYTRAQGLWRDAQTAEPHYTRVIGIDLSQVQPCLAGPRRPQQRVPLALVPAAFQDAQPARDAEPGDAPPRDAAVRDGDVVIAAITSCTNTSNPSSMIGAGLLARNAVRRGLKARPWVKTSLSPGSRVVPEYLQRGGLMEPLEQLGFGVTGFGCMTCIGNSGPLAEPVTEAITRQGIAVAAVLSGNRNFEGRVHPLTRANFLASPALVVAYALAGSVLTDLGCEPIGQDEQGQDVFLRDLWPEAGEIRSTLDATVTTSLFREQYRDLELGTREWQRIPVGTGATFGWQPQSTYIRRPPFFEGMAAEPVAPRDIHGARVLAMFGDMLTTDHISPIGTISAGTPAARYLESLGVRASQFQSYGARRANHDVMRRGTFANIRIRNEMTPQLEGGFTRHEPSGEVQTLFDAAERYARDGLPLVIVAGTEYGAGSSRDWAAKGAKLLGVKAVIAESFERIHRSNLVGIGILPLQFAAGENSKSLGLDGSEQLDIVGLEGPLQPRMDLGCTISRADGSRQRIALTLRLDTEREIDYFRHGGILLHALRQRLGPPENKANHA